MIEEKFLDQVVERQVDMIANLEDIDPGYKMQNIYAMSPFERGKDLGVTAFYFTCANNLLSLDKDNRADLTDDELDMIKDKADGLSNELILHAHYLHTTTRIPFKDNNNWKLDAINLVIDYRNENKEILLTEEDYKDFGIGIVELWSEKLFD